MHPSNDPAAFVDALNAVFGSHRDARPVHAKGIVVRGTFTPDPGAKLLSRAPHLQNAAVPLTVRFSNFSGVPTVEDGHPMASPRGMALKFHLPDGAETDLVTHSFDGFPAATAEEFLELLLAISKSGAGVPRPTALDAFVATHPAAKAFLTAANPLPVSYATLRYFGVNSFKMTSAAGKETIGRYQILPRAGEHFLSGRERAQAAPDYLQEELGQRLAAGPAVFTLVFQLAAPGDRVEDPSIAWPITRQTAPLGSIALTEVVADSAAAERKLLFQPGALPDGIAGADPMLIARRDSYPISFARRTRPQKPKAARPSASPPP